MEIKENMTFVASYSGGKDSILAIHRAKNQGLTPIGLITTHNTNSKRTTNHTTDENLLKTAAESMGIPLTYINTTSETYAADYEKKLHEAKQNGAQICVFGDIDLKGHLDWCTARCENTGLIPYFPLKNEKRKTIVYEFIDDGYSAVIKIVDTTRLNESYLSKTLSRTLVEQIEQDGADICGENGEYHTFVYDGPLFTHKVQYTVQNREQQGKYAVLHLAEKPVFI